MVSYYFTCQQTALYTCLWLPLWFHVYLLLCFPFLLEIRLFRTFHIQRFVLQVTRNQRQQWQHDKPLLLLLGQLVDGVDHRGKCGGAPNEPEIRRKNAATYADFPVTRDRSKLFTSQNEFYVLLEEERAYGHTHGLENRNDWERVRTAIATATAAADAAATEKEPSKRTLVLFDKSVAALRLNNNYYPETCEVEEVLNHALKYLKDNHCNKSILSRINVPTGGKLHVIGDIHGNKEALFKYLDHIGPLSETNQLLFLGDIVDRGTHEWHCMFLVLLYQIRYQAFCTILRGNHEDVATSSAYGMFHPAKRILSPVTAQESMANIFDHLKLCCIVNDKFFCVHGCPPVKNNNTVNELWNIKLPLQLRPGFYPCCIDELLWNDPRPQFTDCIPSERGIGYQFGKTILDNWMQNNNIDRILRAHECPPDKGCAVTDTFGDGCCLTVFSAPYYYAEGYDANGEWDSGSKNQGGYLLISHNDSPKKLELTHVVTGKGECNQSSASDGMLTHELD